MQLKSVVCEFLTDISHETFVRILVIVLVFPFSLECWPVVNIRSFFWQNVSLSGDALFFLKNVSTIFNHILTKPKCLRSLVKDLPKLTWHTVEGSLWSVSCLDEWRCPFPLCLSNFLFPPFFSCSIFAALPSHLSPSVSTSIHYTSLWWDGFQGSWWSPHLLIFLCSCNKDWLGGFSHYIWVMLSRG